MKSNYKLLGPYIREINLRNTEGKEENLLGVSTNKVFIQSIANTVGTNFKKYKIVNHHQFTYVPDTSRRGDRIGIALLEDYQEALVSSAYTVFEIKNHDELLPEYLMMWFRRPEFDRYARFKSHGSVREMFDWEEMCSVELPVPDIEKQKAIVKEYNTIVNRIKLNVDLNKKLEETAQAVYKQWFVDFEFPDENGKPYKSSGGEMVFNEVLDQEIPVGWDNCRILDLFELQRGFDLPIQKRVTGKVAIFAANGLSDFHNESKVKGPAIVTGRSGTIGNVFYVAEDCWPLNTTLWVKNFNIATPLFAYFILKNTELKGFYSGSAVPTLNRNDIHALNSPKPPRVLIENFENIQMEIFEFIDKTIMQINYLNSFNNVLLSKISKG